MKMNYMKKIISIACLSAFLWTGCDYLDIVPENDVKSVETIFEQRAQADRWVATVIGTCPAWRTSVPIFPLPVRMN